MDTYEYPAVSLCNCRQVRKTSNRQHAKKKRILAREFVGAGPDEDLMDYVVYHGTPAVDIFNRSKNPDVYIHPSSNGMMGPGVYVAPDSRLASRLGGPETH